MHSVDPTTEQMIRSVLAYAENRLRLDPVPLDRGSRDPAELDIALSGLLGEEGHNPDQVLGVYVSVLAPAVISADSPRFRPCPAAPGAVARKRCARPRRPGCLRRPAQASGAGCRDCRAGPQ